MEMGPQANYVNAPAERRDVTTQIEEASERTYDDLEPPQRNEHPVSERGIPIPQSSPPLGRSHSVLVPPYYRNYLNLNSMPAYKLYCLSAWYVQISDNVILCANCATSEHTFCVPNRQRAL
ncbi:hypothetical protein P5V15_015636 [Pogonomyrmex californicus]